MCQWSFQNVSKKKECFLRLGTVTPIIPGIQEIKIRRITVQSQPQQTVPETLSLKKLISEKRAGGVAPAVERLPSKRETLSSNPRVKK
jgi:hypothetical protein